MVRQVQQAYFEDVLIVLGRTLLISLAQCYKLCHTQKEQHVY